MRKAGSIPSREFRAKGFKGGQNYQIDYTHAGWSCLILLPTPADQIRILASTQMDPNNNSQKSSQFAELEPGAQARG